MNQEVKETEGNLKKLVQKQIGQPIEEEARDNELFKEKLKKAVAALNETHSELFE